MEVIIIFVICIVLMLIFCPLAEKKFKQEIKQEFGLDNKCENCYYKKRCEELEKKAND